MTREDWLPIDQLEDKYEQDLLIAAPELIDLDFNQHGISQGYFQDDEGWLGVGWDACNDEATRKVCNPTHFMRIAGPYTDEERDSLHEGLRA